VHLGLKSIKQILIMKGLHVIAFILLVIGGLNWLLFGLFSWDVGLIFGETNNIVARIIYVLVGLSAIIEIFAYKSVGKSSGGMKAAGPSNPPMMNN